MRKAALDALTSDLRDRLDTLGDSAAVFSDDEFTDWFNRIIALDGRAPVPDVDASFGRPDIDVVTSDTFRYRDVGWRLHSKPELHASAVFQTSGTTRRFRGRHLLRRTDIYSASVIAAFRRLVLARFDLRHLVALVPQRAARPDSSLSFMLGDFAKRLFPAATTWGLTDSGIDEDQLRRLFASPPTGPTLVFATTLAASGMLEAGFRVQLAPGSVLMTTGGAKKRSGEVDARAIDDQLAERLGVDRIASEYGMTELLSQAYKFGDEDFRLPPWCRVQVVRSDGRLASSGELGLLRFIDLANLQTAMIVQTVDMGTSSEMSRFRYVGRAPGSEIRGCSLTFEELAG